VGGGLAWGDGVFRWDAFGLTLIAALAIQVAANFANDVSDARRGADPPERSGPPRMVALGVIEPGAMWAATWAAIGLAAIAGISLTIIAGPAVLVIGVVSIAVMLGYVGGPIPYGYFGLGEVSVFLFFGVVATVGSRFVHDGTAPLPAWLLSIPVGLLVSAILVANNYRDIETDAAVGKRTLAVIIGRERTRVLFAVIVYGAYVLIGVFAVLDLIPRASAIALVVTPMAAVPVRMVQKGASGSELIRVLRRTAGAHLWTGVALALGCALG
jgi:1,4-dihydroxy-2-naphthoate octaprenyltransferase